MAEEQRNDSVPANGRRSTHRVETYQPKPRPEGEDWARIRAAVAQPEAHKRSTSSPRSER